MIAWDVVSEISVSGYYIMGYRIFVTLVTAKNIKLLYCARTRACIARCYLASSRAWPLHAVVLLVFLELLVHLVFLVLLELLVFLVHLVLLENLPL